MKKAFRFLCLVFDSMGQMIYVPPHKPYEALKEIPSMPDDGKGIGRYFEAAFGYIGNAVHEYEKQERTGA